MQKGGRVPGMVKESALMRSEGGELGAKKEGQAWARSGHMQVVR